jgi:hypothetical protein
VAKCSRNPRFSKSFFFLKHSYNSYLSRTRNLCGCFLKRGEVFAVIHRLCPLSQKWFQVERMQIRSLNNASAKSGDSVRGEGGSFYSWGNKKSGIYKEREK